MNFEQAVIVNIYPAPIFVRRPAFPGSPFRVKACKDMAQPEILVVGPQNEKYRMADKDLYNRWGADQVAVDIVGEASKLVHGVDPSKGARPGIWASKGARLVPAEADPKSFGPGVICMAEYKVSDTLVRGNFHIPQEEIDLHRVAQDKMGERLLQIMEIHAKENNPAARSAMENLRPVATVFSRWFKLENLDWQKTTSSRSNINCEVCGNIQPAGYMKCQKCLEVIDPIKWAAYQKKQNAIAASLDAEDEDTKAAPLRTGKKNQQVAEPVGV